MEPKGFLGALFDFSFTAYVTTKLVKVLYVVAAVFAGITALVLFVGLAAAGFSESAAVGAGALILGIVVAPLAFLLLVLYARVMLELIIVVFRIAEHTAALAEHTQREASNSAPS